MSPRRRPKSTTTVRQAADEWWQGRYARGELKHSTLKAYRDALDYFCYSVGWRRYVCSLTKADVETFQAEQVARRISADTLRGRLTVVRLWTGWLVEEGYVEKDPFRGIKLPRKPRSVPRGLPAADIGRALAHARDTRERLMMSLMVREGLRAIEVSRVDLGDVDAIERTLFVRQGKGDHQRLVPLTRETLDLVEQYVREERGPAAGRLIQSRKPNPWNVDDGVMSHTVFVQVSRALKRAGIAESSHALRHSYAHALLAAGAPVRDIQHALGHATLVTTEIYLPRANVERLRTFVGKTEYRGDMLDDEQRGAG